MNPPKMTMLILALALCLAMAACRQDSGTVPTPSDTQAVAPDISDSPTAAAGQLRSTPGAETQPTPTTTPTPVSPTPTPENVREAVAEPTATPTPTPAAVSPTPTPPEVVSVVDQSTSTPTRSPVSPSPSRSLVSPTPTPTPEWVEIGRGGWVGVCGPNARGEIGPSSSTQFGVEYSTQFLEWTSDGRQLIFSDRGTRPGLFQTSISIVDDEGSHVRTIVDANPRWHFVDGFYADLSPDGSRVVYSSCEYPRCLKGGTCDEEAFYSDDFNYEIAAIGIDGTSPERLTRNDHYDHYPVWSPDGTRIAFLVSPDLVVTDRVQLFTMSADGSDVSSALTHANLKLGLYPPVWSPNGLWLAFIVRKGHSSRVLHTVWAAGGVSAKRLYETTVLPSWSPDGERLAFADGAGIHTARLDGTGLAQVWAKGEAYPPISQVAWSPDGSELLFVAVHEFPGVGDPEEQGVFIVGADGSGLRRLPVSHLWGWPGPPAWAVWSPDGSRIAVYSMGQAFGRMWHPSLILTMARDGTDMRFLARVDAGIDNFGRDGRFHAWSPPPSEKPDLAVCSHGSVVPEAQSSPGLVHDCEALLTIRDTLTGSAEVEWNENLPISEWEGITIGGSPPRVHELELARRGLTGRLPPDLGRLTELRRLQIRGEHSNEKGDALTGAIPPELGRLTKLEVLDLSRNFLSGGIPPELGSLAELAGLDLSYNFLSGSIPPELRGLENLRWLDLGYNIPSLCVPPELPDMWRQSGERSKESVRLCKPEEVDSP